MTRPKTHERWKNIEDGSIHAIIGTANDVDTKKYPMQIMTQTDSGTMWHYPYKMWHSLFIRVLGGCSVPVPANTSGRLTDSQVHHILTHSSETAQGCSHALLVSMAKEITLHRVTINDLIGSMRKYVSSVDTGVLGKHVAYSEFKALIKEHEEV